MKKLSFEKKQYYIKYSRKKHRHELERKEIRKRLRYEKLSGRIKQKRAKRFIEDPKKVEHETYQAPTIFSLIENPTTVISYFEKAKNTLAKNIPVVFDLKMVVQMGPETLTYLCALIKEEGFHNHTPIKGNIPDNPVLREMFKKSGFYDNVISGFSSESENRDVNDKLIHQVTREKVESVLAGDVCRSAMKHTFGTDDPKRQRFYRILIECMGNTWNHANAGERNAVYSWWLLAYKEPTTKITKFCFLDLGVGIFGSLEKKYKKNKLEEWLSWFTPKKNKETLLKIFQGEKKTSTVNLSGRGLGINNIYRLVKLDKTIKNFTLLSNDIMAKIGYNKPDKIEKIKSDFEGTLYYWELTPNYE